MDFLKLPPEVQHAVVAQMPRADLLRFQRGSQYCRDLANQKVWRSLKFYIENRLSGNNGGSSSSSQSEFRLMDALQTLTCSSHDYARYIKSIALYGYPVDGTCLRQVFRIRYYAGSSAQKGLNINLLAVLRKAINLERFVMIAPLELSDAVWQSLVEKPLSRIEVSLNGRQHFVPDRRTMHMFPGDLFKIPPHGGSLSYHHIRRCSQLQHLSLIDLNELDHLDQIAACIRASTSTLTDMQLCLSEQLFEKARKPSPGATTTTHGIIPPPPMEDYDDEASEVTDEDGQPVPDPGVVQAENESIRHNRTAQDAILARIFSMETDKVDKIVEKSLKSSAEARSKQQSAQDEAMAEKLPELVSRLLKGDKMSEDELDMIDKLRSQMDEVFRSKKRAKHNRLPAAPHGVKVSGHHPGSSSLADPFASQPPPPPPGMSWPGIKSSPSQALTIPGIPKPYSPSIGGPSPSASSPYVFSHPPPPKPAFQHSMIEADILEKFNFDSYIEDPPLPEHLHYPEHPSKNPIPKFPATGNMAKKLHDYLTKYPNAASIYYSQPAVKKLAQLAKKSAKMHPLPPPVASSSGTELGGPASTSSPSITQGSTTKEAPYEDMNIDMEHPDEISGESGDDQESIADDDEINSSAPASVVEAKGKGKGKAKEHFNSRPASPAKRSLAETTTGDDQNKEASSAMTSPEQVMKDWIRKEHGLSLQKFSLCLVPLKASVVGKAIRLHNLQEIVLLSVGGQGPFWQMMARAQEDAPLALRHVHTDDVSKSLLDCISKCQGMRTLILRRRNKKDKFNTTSKEPASMEEIRKLAIQPHTSTLKVLDMQDDETSGWCLTQEVLTLLCARASCLEELAFQSGSARYNEFLRELRNPRVLPKLKTFQLINSGLDRGGIGLHAGLGAPPPPAPPLSNSSSVSSNEMYDSQLIMANSYRGALDLTRDSIKQRKEYGDKQLRHFGVYVHFVKVGDAKKAPLEQFPAWLKDEYDAEQEQSTVVGPRKTFQEWVKGTRAGWTMHVSLKTTSLSQVANQYTIFTPQVMYARLV